MSVELLLLYVLASVGHEYLNPVHAECLEDLCWQH